jgi:hypothetical protein
MINGVLTCNLHEKEAEACKVQSHNFLYLSDNDGLGVCFAILIHWHPKE